VTVPASCVEAFLSYNKQLEWKREKMGIKNYKMGTQVRHETRGELIGREQECPRRAL